MTYLWQAFGLAEAVEESGDLYGRSEIWPAADCLEDLPSLQLDDQTANLFLHGNAERVFGLTGALASA